MGSAANRPDDQPQAGVTVHKRPLIVEALPGEHPKSDVMTQGFIMQLREIGRKAARSADIEHFLFHPAFPVDPRHNAKIHREELKLWAERELA